MCSSDLQGVGFRYTTQELADRYPVAGYVRNLLTGEVELIAEGEADQVQAFLDAIRVEMAGYIYGSTVEDESPKQEAKFVIRH